MHKIGVNAPRQKTRNSTVYIPVIFIFVAIKRLNKNVKELQKSLDLSSFRATYAISQA
jgi:hypothetical protein